MKELNLIIDKNLSSQTLHYPVSDCFFKLIRELDCCRSGVIRSQNRGLRYKILSLRLEGILKSKSFFFLNYSEIVFVDKKCYKQFPDLGHF